MRALTLHQPWASLIMCGAKTIETRDHPPAGPMCPDGVRAQPGHRLERGQTIAVHAGKDTTSLRQIWDTGHRRSMCDDALIVAELHRQHDLGTLHLETLGHELRARELLPTGVVLGTVTILDALEIRDDIWLARPYLETNCMPAWCGGRLIHHPGPMAEPEALPTRDVTDQLPFGFYGCGRWGWLLADPLPFAEPVPARGGQGVWDWTVS